MALTARRISPITRARTGRVAVVDIGSNSIRVVVYDRLSRAPLPIFNEKVLCGLGRDLSSTGRLNPEGVDMALKNLARFRRLIEAMAVRHVDVIATAAVREAEDGADFVAEVKRCSGLERQGMLDLRASRPTTARTSRSGLKRPRTNCK